MFIYSKYMHSLTALYSYINIEHHYENPFPCCCHCCLSDDLCPSYWGNLLSCPCEYI